jgi:hypothetical protein
MEEEDNENDHNFKPEKEGSASEVSDDTLPGLNFVPRNDR